MNDSIVVIAGLSVFFETRHGEVRAVNNADLEIRAGERASLLGESGCGKTVLALTMLSLLPKNSRVTGSVLIDGIDVAGSGTARHACGRIVSLCWSNAERFFNPVLPVGDQIVEAYTVHHPGEKRAGREKALFLLDRLGFEDPAAVFRSYPFQLSGGMNQRAMIAMSMIDDPRVLVVDEPTRGLDDEARERVIVSIEGLDCVTLLLITHDVDCARRLTRTAYVMKSGSIIDRGPSSKLLVSPSHPYTERLVRSCPSLWDERIPGTGRAPGNFHPMSGSA